MSDIENRIGNVFALMDLIFQCKGQQIMAKSSLHLVFANVLLECSHAYLIMYCLWLLFYYIGRVA